MSFLIRSRPSQKWGRQGSSSASTSFSVRTGRRVSAEPDSMVLRSGQEAIRDCLAAAHFLRNETQAARTAVEALDSYILKLASFQDKALELIEEAHRALSRLERAVALSAAPELIVVACEIKVACHRGLHLFRTYGKYRYLGKVIALATRSSITAKFDGVIGRLTAIMPLDRSPSFTSIQPKAAAAAVQPCHDAAAGALHGAVQRGNRPSLEEAAAAVRQLAQQQQQQQQQQQAVSSSSGGFAATGSPSGRLQGAMRSSDAAVGSVMQTHGAAEGADTSAVLSVVLRSSEAAKVTCISFVDLPGASTCVWWAAGDTLEFYSTSTQSTTSFAPYTERAAITAVAVDSMGNVWCANSRGAVMMRQQRNWEQVFVEHAFSSCVRCLATDADSDVIWAGDEAGRLAVFRFVEEGGSCKLECTATIMPGRADLGMKSESSSALLDIKPKTLSRWHTLSCMRLKDQQRVAEGPIRTMLVRDDRAWVGGGRTDPWIGLFDAVLGTQLDMWSCNQYGSCLAMASMLTSDALADANAPATTAAAAAKPRQPARSASEYGSPGLDVPTSVPEDNIGEDPRSGWRLITGHESGQLLLWNAASDRLQPLIKIGDTGLSPVRALCVMEEQGLLAVVHANGDLAMFLRPLRDRDWLMGPNTAAVAAAAGCLMEGAPSGPSGAGAIAGGGASGHVAEQLSPDTSGTAPADRGRSGGGSAAAAAARLTTIKPRRVVLRSHRSMLVAAAACSSGVLTASAPGSIKLWPAAGLAKEAERCGLLPVPAPVQATRESSLTSRSAGSLNRNQQQPMARQNSDSLISNASSPQANGCSAAADSAAGEAAAAAAAWQMSGGVLQQTNQLAVLQQQQQQQLQQRRDFQQEHHAAMAAWQQQLHPQDSISHPHQQLYGISAFAQQQQQQQLQAEVTSLARLSDPGLQWLQQQSQQALFLSGPGAAASAALPEQIGNPLIQEQQLPLERRSAPLDIPWQANMVTQPSAAAGSARSTGMGTAMFARLTAQHQLGQLGGSPRFSGVLLSDALAGTSQTPSAAGSMMVESPRGGFQAPHGAPSALDVPMDSAPRYAAPRAPKALRDLELGNRDRRRSERRLSKGANIAWSTCQIINASELRMLECIGGGAYGQVFLAEWMGTQVAAKQLLSFQNKAKDEVTRRKANARVAKHDFSRDDDDSDSDSDTDSVDSVEEEVAAELKQLMDEVWVLGSLSHPSITRFCALCLDPPMIVMQYYPHGSLYDLLKRGRRGEKRALHELSWAKRLDMLRDIASGMVFLHSRKPPIVHGDLRSPNLLLDLTIERDRPRFHVKIADFGLARMVGPTSSIAVSKVTNPRWSAPEVLRNSVVSLSADVFSFAVVMWELLTWQQPYEDMMSVQVLFSVMQNFRPEIPPEEELPGKPGPTLPRYLSLMERCWAEDEHARPTFEEVLAKLDDLRTCESGHARLRGGESHRSQHGSTRVSYSEAPGTPTGRCLGGGSSLAASAPGSNISSAPNSGRDCGPMALAAAAAAGAAAEAAASTVGRQRSIDAGGVLACDRRRGTASSDPGTPTGTGVFGGDSSSAPGWTPLVGGSAPTSGGSSTSSGSTSNTHKGSASSPGALEGQQEVSFAMPRPPALAGLAAAGALGAAPGPVSPARTPSRLGPTRMPSTMGSPTAMTHGMASGHDAEPAAERSATDTAGAGRVYQRHNSGGPVGVSINGPQQSLAHHGSRLRRLSWGTLEGSLQSGGSKQLGLQASRSSWGGSMVHEYLPASPGRAGDRPLSLFSASQACEEAAACEPGVFAPCGAGAAAVEAQRPACLKTSLHANPFATVQAQAGQQDSLQQPFRPGAGAQVRGSGMCCACPVQQPAALPAALIKAPVRPPSPFAAVQQVKESPAAAAPSAMVPDMAQQPQRAYSPFAAARRQSTEHDSISVSAGQSRVPSSPLMGSRQATDDSAVGAQPPARPCSPTQSTAEPSMVIPMAAAGAGPHQAKEHLAANPFTAMQQAVAPEPSAAARSASPFAAAQQLQQFGSADLRVESMSGSPFGGAGAYLGPQSSDGSSQGSSPVDCAPTAAGAHKPTRFGQSPAAGQAEGAAAASSQQVDWNHQQAHVIEQPWPASSPFAAVHAVALQGPIVSQQAKAVLSRLNSHAGHSHGVDAQDAVPQGHQQQQGESADVGACVPALQSCSPVCVPSGTRSPLQSFAFMDNGQHSKLQAQRLAAVAAASAESEGGTGDLGPSCDSITFPSGLGATGSVVFLQGPPKRPQPRQ